MVSSVFLTKSTAIYAAKVLQLAETIDQCIYSLCDLTDPTPVKLYHFLENFYIYSPFLNLAPKYLRADQFTKQMSPRKIFSTLLWTLGTSK